MEIETLTLSSKGQLVIPEKTRKRLRLRQGTKFRFLEVGGDILLSPLRPPSSQEFEALIKAGGPWPEQTSEEEDLVNQICKDVRARRRSQHRR